MELNEKSKFSKSLIRLIIESILIFSFLIMLIWGASNNNICVRHTSEYYQERKCKGNIRLLKEAVEMYLMDHPETTLNIDQNLLVEGKYIRENLGKNYNPPCNYKNLGNLSKDGVIYCELHGDINGIKIDPKDDMKVY